MFLSRVEVPWADARNPYDIHRRLWQLFPGEPRETRANANEARDGFLFRVEESTPGRSARLLVQSRKAPQLAPALALIGTREFSPRPVSGQRLAFLLTANPIKTIQDSERADKPNKRSEKCRVPIIRDEERHAWLARKLCDAAVIEAVSVRPHSPLYFRKGNQGGKVVAVTFEGLLRVLDPMRLSDYLENGLGPAKAFGCGLLLVRRL